VKRVLLITLALLAALGFTALGVWQVERREWKLDLIARVEAGIHAAPVPLSDWPDVAEYRRVRVQGDFLYDRETLVKAVTERGEGFWVMTPLRTAAGIVLVNRGFAPSDNSARWRGPDTGQANVIGLLRTTEPGGGFLRSNDPAADRWYSRDVAAIARARGLGAVAPVFVDADAAPNPGGYPVGGLTVVAFRNNHLVYALTWFALAGLCAVAAVFVLRQPRRR
jgi:surfeit locus 1 family protein